MTDIPVELSEMLSSLYAGLEEMLGDKLEAMYLYGSRARGDNRKDSDIDVLIVLRDDIDYFDMVLQTGP